MMIRFAITLSKSSELIVTKRVILLTQSRALQKLLQVFLFLYFWCLFRNQKEHLVTGILTLMHLAETSNRKHLQKSKNCVKLHLKDNKQLYKLKAFSFQNSVPPYFRHKLKSIHSCQIEVKKLCITPSTQVNFLIV